MNLYWGKSCLDKYREVTDKEVSFNKKKLVNIINDKYFDLGVKVAKKIQVLFSHDQKLHSDLSKSYQPLILSALL